MNKPFLKCSRQHQTGFSIIEALIASVIVAVGLLGAAKFQAEMIQQGGIVKDRTQALSEANKKLEEIRVNNTPSFYAALVNGTNTIVPQSGTIANLAMDWRVTDYTNPPFKAIDVRAGWNGSNGGKAVSLSTYVAGHDPTQSGRSLLLKSQAYQPPTPTSFDAIIAGAIYKVNGNASWTVSVDQGSCVTSPTAYVCSVAGLAISATQSLTVTFNPNDTACGANQVSASLNVDSPLLVHDFYHASNANQCPT